MAARVRSFLVGAMLPALLACGGDGGDGGPDAAPLVREDRAYLITRLVLPVVFEDVVAAAFEWPGESEPVNHMGDTIVALLDLLEGVPVQADLEAGFDAGAALQVMLVNSAAPDEDDPAATVRFGDVTADGAGYRVDGELPVIAEGEVDGGELIATSDDTSLTLAMPLLLGQAASRVDTRSPRIRAELTDATLTGVFGAGLTVDDLHQDVYPAIASLVTRAITEQTANAASLSSIFDGDGDGTVTVAELQDSATLQGLTRPDLDLDGDGSEDHLSTGIAFEAERVEIVP